MRVTVPAFLDVPQPRLVPQDNDAEDEAVRVVNASEGIFAEFYESCGFVLGTTTTPPTLYLALRQIRLFG